MRHSPLKDFELFHSDFVVVSGMINTVIAAAMNGECTPSDIGNSLLVLKEVIDKRLEMLEEQNRKLHGLSVLYRDAISDKEISGIFEEYRVTGAEGGEMQKEAEEAYDKVCRFMELLPEDKEKPAWISVREAGAVSRKQGFYEGFRSASRFMAELEEAYG